MIGDDIKSQVGATIVHRMLANLFRERGVRVDRTYQLNFGGNTDFLNMLERERLESKKISKTQAVTSQLDMPLAPDDIHVGPSDHVPWLTDRKWAYIRLEGTTFGGVPLNAELKLEVWDSPEFRRRGDRRGALRQAGARPRHRRRARSGPSSYFMKSPPEQFTDAEARERRSPSSPAAARPARSDAPTVFPRPSCCARQSRRLPCGRMPGVRLGGSRHGAGRAAGQRMARDLRRSSSQPARADPRNRASRFRGLLDRGRGRDDLDEVDFGDWSGKAFDELQPGPALDGAGTTSAARPRRLPARRMEAVQRRMVGRMASLARAFPDTALVLVSHADVIRMAVCECLGCRSRNGLEFEVSPASITTVVAGGWGGKLLGLNECH